MRIAVLVILISIISAPAAQAQVKGDIVGPGMPKYPIAVSPLKSMSASGEQGRVSEGVADAISYDLDLSGWFRVIDRAAYIEHPQKSGDTLGTFDFKDWSTLGAVGLVKGRFTLQGEELTVEIRLFDVSQAKEIIGKRYTASAKDYRRIAHKFADEIINQFTGVPGIFNTRIAYVSTSGGRFKEVHVSHLDGTEKYQVTNNRTINLSPAWTPDGKSILYTSYKDRNPSLYLFELYSAKDIKFSSRTGLNLGGKWSPDGQTVAVSLERGGNSDIYLLDRAGNVVRRLTEDPAIDVSPAWSPDGRQLVFVSDRSGSPQLYILDVSNGRTRRLTYTGGYNTSPDWSPKGDKVAYISRIGGRFSVFSVPTEGGEPLRLTSNSADNEDPAWSPDGRFIVFSSNRAGRYHLYIMQASGENQRRLTGSGGDDTKPSWSPRLE
jgi:TolB protein